MSTFDAPAAAQDIAEGTLIGDHLRVIRRLGVGGMGEVYLAENIHLPDQRCAIKVLRKELSSIPRYAELLTSEAHKQSLLVHDNIVQLHDFFPWQQRYCLILAFVEGTTLADLIDAQPGGLPEARALDLMLDVLKGLNYAHEHGVLHCDVKPPNVLVDREQRVRVTDFGIARDMGLATSSHLGAAGTPEYMSPEQVTNPDQVDHRADVYSAGVMLFEMLTGHLPYEHDRSAGEVRFPQLTDEPADLRLYRKNLSPALARIVTSALQRDRTLRIQGCVEFQRAIIKYRRNKRLLPAFVVVSLLSVAGATGAYWWQQQVQARADAQRVEADRVAAQQRIENEARARQAIQASIDAGVTQLGLLCRETKLLRSREEAWKTATESGGSDMKKIADGFKVQIEEMKMNRSDRARRYSESIQQLAEFEPQWVAEMAAAYPRSNAEAERLVSAVREDHAAAIAKRTVRNVSELQTACPR